MPTVSPSRNTGGLIISSAGQVGPAFAETAAPEMDKIAFRLVTCVRLPRRFLRRAPGALCLKMLANQNLKPQEAPDISGSESLDREIVRLRAWAVAENSDLRSLCHQRVQELRAEYARIPERKRSAVFKASQIDGLRQIVLLL